MTIRAHRGGWKVIVDAGLDPLTGKQRQITRQVDGSRKQAEKVEARRKTEVADDRHAGTKAKPFGELLDLWLTWRTDNGKPISPRTVNDYRSLIEIKSKPASAADDSPRAGGGCRSTVPSWPVPPPATARPAWSHPRAGPGAVRRRGRRSRAGRVPAARGDHGLRPGVVCALRWSDLDLDAGEVSVSGNIVTTKGLPEGYVRRPPKSAHGVRALALDPGTVAHRKAHRARCEEVAAQLELTLTADSSVFPCVPPGRCSTAARSGRTR